MGHERRARDVAEHRSDEWQPPAAARPGTVSHRRDVLAAQVGVVPVIVADHRMIRGRRMVRGRSMVRRAPGVVPVIVADHRVKDRRGMVHRRGVVHHRRRRMMHGRRALGVVPVIIADHRVKDRRRMVHRRRRRVVHRRRVHHHRRPPIVEPELRRPRVRRRQIAELLAAVMRQRTVGLRFEARPAVRIEVTGHLAGRLLDHVLELVAHQLLAVGSVGRGRAVGEQDVTALGRAAPAVRREQRAGRAADVNAHAVEPIAGLGLELALDRPVERATIAVRLELTIEHALLLRRDERRLARRRRRGLVARRARGSVLAVSLMITHGSPLFRDAYSLIPKIETSFF
ncbi:MAG TPA: hypothetical protein VHW23_34660 [Kofleriaceae bacterium]|nr:hypothetical protein [Kofleriaceae bacterium]